MYLNYFDKFKNMSPYLYINTEEWNHIKETYSKEDVCESLAKIAMDYPLPYQEISEEDEKSNEKVAQTYTDEHIKIKDTKVEDKEKEIMTI